eukprot:GSChrysophyteH1.ASY1.ANO1.1538.1 assembled CDS
MILILMGVSGCGKTTVGAALAKRLEAEFLDGDDFHSEANKAKMKNGDALTDSDRKEWLVCLNNKAKKAHSDGCSLIIACSALKRGYRESLGSGIRAFVRFVYLRGSRDLISSRLDGRTGHFMSAGLLDSQFAILEESPDLFQCDIAKSVSCLCDEIVKNFKNTQPIGLVGCGVMGKSLMRNLVRHSIPVAAFNRYVDLLQADEELHSCASFCAAYDGDVAGFVSSLQRPRAILVMVNAGPAVQAVIDSLCPFLDAGDVIIDAGNSNFRDTLHRQSTLMQLGVHLVGAGVSGGEKGALWGPSIMPGGAGYEVARPYLEAIAAVDNIPGSGKSCCSYLGSGSCGHFVKMAHNGLEYAEMQLLAEVYAVLLAKGLGNDEIASLVSLWPKEGADSYLMEITLQILRKRDPLNSQAYLLDSVLDKASNKGTGNWTAITSVEMGIPSTMVTTALFARYISAQKDLRKQYAILLASPSSPPADIKQISELEVSSLYQAFFLSRLVNHHQVLLLLHEASEHFNWRLDIKEIIRVWTNGSILRSQLLVDIYSVYSSHKLFDHAVFQEKVKSFKSSLKSTVISAINVDVAVPCLSEALTYLNGITCSNSTASLVAAQRDHFGAHGFHRKCDGAGLEHAEWSEN